MLGPEIEVIRGVMEGEMHNMPYPVFISSMVVHIVRDRDAISLYRYWEKSYFGVSLPRFEPASAIFSE